MESLNQLISVPTWLLLVLGLGGFLVGILMSLLIAWATAVISPPPARKADNVVTPKTEQQAPQLAPKPEAPKPVSFAVDTKQQPPARKPKTVAPQPESTSVASDTATVHLTKEQSQQLQDKLKNRKMYSSVEIADVLRTTPEQAVSWIVDMKGKGYKTFYSNHGQRYVEAKAVADQFK